MYGKSLVEMGEGEGEGASSSPFAECTEDGEIEGTIKYQGIDG
jgi:hypothetical protein